MGDTLGGRPILFHYIAADQTYPVLACNVIVVSLELLCIRRSSGSKERDLSGVPKTGGHNGDGWRGCAIRYIDFR
jgi:hypothetical protein